MKKITGYISSSNNVISGSMASGVISSKIENITVNGVEQEIVDKTVNLTIPEAYDDSAIKERLTSIEDKEAAHNISATAHQDIRQLIDGKVDKVSGKDLSTNDYSTEEKTKLAGIEDGANKTVVDAELSSSSTNPVQNKVINISLSEKANVSEVYTKTEIDAKETALNNTIENNKTESSTALSSHNSSVTAHEDIRSLITGLTDRLNALINTDDTTLDQLSEIVSYIKENRQLIESMTDKISVSDIVDNLTTTDATKVLSAHQGKILKDLIDEIIGKESAWDAKSDFSGSYNDLTDKPALFSGDYDDLSNKPELFSGAYEDLTGKPDLFSGDYNDLTNKPTLFSGSYNDLTDKPTITTGTGTCGCEVSVDSEGNATYKSTTVDSDGDATVKGLSTDSSGDSVASLHEGMLEITYASLKELRDNSSLQAGMQYRITDYKCGTIQEDTRAMNNQFDIIVTADDEKTLNHKARAIKHDGDTYFEDCQLEKWQVWYDLDNSEKYTWIKVLEHYIFIGDETINSYPTGNSYEGSDGRTYNECTAFIEDNKLTTYITEIDEKYYLCTSVGGYDSFNVEVTHVDEQEADANGVVYRLIDDLGNDVPYDFKNIQFKRYSLTSTDEDSPYIGYNGIKELNNYGNYPSDVTFNEDDFKWRYTFDDSEGNDASLLLGNWVYNNSFASDSLHYYGIKLLNNVFSGRYVYNNVFGEACYNNTFITSSYNYFGNSFFDNIFGEYISYNRFEDYCYNNAIANNLYYSTFGTEFAENIIYDNCSFLNFNGKCSNNIVGKTNRYINFDGSNCYIKTAENAHTFRIKFGVCGDSTSNPLVLDNSKDIYHFNDIMSYDYYSEAVVTQVNKSSSIRYKFTTGFTNGKATYQVYYKSTLDGTTWSSTTTTEP